VLSQLLPVQHWISIRNDLSERPRYLAQLLLLLVWANCFAAAGTLRGTIINGTTGRPAAGDEVVILKLSPDGMAEQGRTRTDSSGRFTLTLADNESGHVLRVVHQAVTYHESVAPGTNSLVVRVYDVARKLAGIAAVMDVQRFEATDGTLEIKQLVTVRNVSKPPRTLMNDTPFEFRLPPDARVQSGMVQVEDHQPLKQDPAPGEQRGQYHFTAPIRPGDTRFAVVYRVPYGGSAMIAPQVRNRQERFVAMLPKTMKFEPVSANIFKPISGTTPDDVQATGPVSANAVVVFRVSGTGTLDELRGRRQQAQEEPEADRPRPGGGLGPPIDAPDPLHNQRWFILGGLTILIGLGTTRMMRRSSSLARLPERTSETNIKRVKGSRKTVLLTPMQGRQRRRHRLVQTERSRMDPSN